MVECIEQLGSELEIAILIDINLLRDREIEICQAWAAHDTDAFIAKRLGSRTRYRESIRIEPTFNRALRSRQLGISDEIRPSHSVAAKVNYGASAKRCGEWQPALNSVNSRNLPVSEEQ